MRVVIAADSIGPLSSAEAGRLLAAGWRDADTAVVPMGESGRGFGRAVADLLGREPTFGADGPLVSTVVDAPAALVVAVESADPAPSPSDAESGSVPIDRLASSVPHGELLRAALETSEQGADVVVLDLSGNRAHDAGAGLLAGLGAVADVELRSGVEPLAGINHLDLDPVRTLLAGRRLIGVVDADQRELPLLGLRGITSRRGRDSGMDPELLLRTDAALERLARLAGAGLADPVPSDAPGAGACGGLGLAVLALGGRLTTGPGLCAELGRLTERLRGADLVVTGCSSYDFAHRGGGVLAEVAGRAAATLLPCIVLAGEVLIGAREMRTMGVEAAYPVHESALDQPEGEVTADQLGALAHRVAHSWSW